MAETITKNDEFSILITKTETVITAQVKSLDDLNRRKGEIENKIVQCNKELVDINAKIATAIDLGCKSGLAAKEL